MRVIKLDFLIQFVFVEKKPKYKNIVNTSVASFIRCITKRKNEKKSSYEWQNAIFTLQYAR